MPRYSSFREVKVVTTTSVCRLLVDFMTKDTKRSNYEAYKQIFLRLRWKRVVCQILVWGCITYCFFFIFIFLSVFFLSVSYYSNTKKFLKPKTKNLCHLIIYLKLSELQKAILWAFYHYSVDCFSFSDDCLDFFVYVIS